MPQWIIALIGLVTGATMVILCSLLQRPTYRAQQPAVKYLGPDVSPASILRQSYGCSLVTVRPLLPADIHKASWVWGDNEAIETSSYQLIELTGIDCSKWAAVSLFNNSIGSTRIGVLTSWDNTASVIIKPNMRVYLRPMEIDGERAAFFALKGKVYEPAGAYII